MSNRRPLRTHACPGAPHLVARAIVAVSSLVGLTALSVFAFLASRRAVNQVQGSLCGCLSVLEPVQARRDLKDELVELLESPSLDELSDVMFALGRLLGALSNRVYVPMPYGSRHIKKIVVRFEASGCVRSERHLVNGRCPSAPRR